MRKLLIHTYMQIMYLHTCTSCLFNGFGYFPLCHSTYSYGNKQCIGLLDVHCTCIMYTVNRVYTNVYCSFAYRIILTCTIYYSSTQQCFKVKFEFRISELWLVASDNSFLLSKVHCIPTESNYRMAQNFDGGILRNLTNF